MVNVSQEYCFLTFKNIMMCKHPNATGGVFPLMVRDVLQKKSTSIGHGT
jgi:hypothetical protein